MAFKFVVFAAFVAAANAGVLPVGPLAYHQGPLAYAAGPVAKAVVTKTIDADFDPHPQYSYSYDVQDSITGDNKYHQEIRDGDVVSGSYSLLESDGTRRTVDYTADAVNGFNAVVRKEPAGLAVKAVGAPVAYAAPVAKIGAPVAYATPAVAKIAAPAYSKFAFAAPAGYAQAAYAPAAYAQAAYAAPAAYAPGPAYAAHSYAAPALAAYSSPAYYH